MKNTCQLALITHCSAFIQKAASSTFNKLIEIFKEYDIELGEIIKKFVSLFHLIDIKGNIKIYNKFILYKQFSINIFIP